MTHHLTPRQALPCSLLRVLAYWNLAQQNPTVVGNILTMAVKLGAPNPEIWAAHLLNWATQHSIELPLAAKLAGLGLQLAVLQEDGLDERPLSTLRDKQKALREIEALAVDLQAAKTKAITTPSDAITPGATRSETQARINFNQPQHWVLNAQGQLMPDGALLTGAPKALWAELKKKFGPALSTSLFNALVLGELTTMLSVMDKEKSQLTLTFQDVANFQFVAHTDGKRKIYGIHSGKPSGTPAHDFFHVVAGGYGLTIEQETIGGRHTSAVIQAVFERPFAIEFDRSRRLGQQPEVAQKLLAFIEKQYAESSLDLLHGIIEFTLHSKNAQRKLFQEWGSKSTAQKTSALEQFLQENGFLAHLNLSQRKRVLSTIYDASNDNSFEALIVRLGSQIDLSELGERFSAWVTATLAPALVAESAMPGMSFDEFKRRSAKTLAAALVLERASNFALINGDKSEMGNHRPGGRAFQSVDLCTTFADALLEVNAALDIKP
jgi:hypothetical protein